MSLFSSLMDTPRAFLNLTIKNQYPDGIKIPEYKADPMNNLSPNESLAAGPAKMPAALCEAGLFYLAAIDKEGYLTFTNAYFLKHFFSGNHTSNKRNILDLIHPADRNHFKDVIGKCLSEGRPQLTEIRVINRAFQQTEWEITYLEGLPVRAERFLCIGYRKNYHPANQESGF